MITKFLFAGIKNFAEALGEQAVWIILALGGLALICITPAHAGEVTPADAENYCRQQVVDMGGEVAQSLEISGPTWRASWGQDIPGDTITAGFKKGSLVLSEQNSVLADHVLTILHHREKGINVLVARYNDNRNTVATLIIPMTVTLSGPGVGCYTGWFIR